MVKNNMMKIKINNTIKNIFYIFFICVATFMMSFQNYIANIDRSEEIIIETSNINSSRAFKGKTEGNYKVAVLNYDEHSYYIKVNCKAQKVIVYIADENGNYNIPVKTMICSTGRATPNKGVYKISNKYEWRYLVGGVYGQYSTRITGQILFHSIPYTKKDKSSLEYWEYDKLGQPASKGCVRLTVEDAKWIYDYCKSGTKVEFTNEDNIDNIDFQEPIKITNLSDELRCWDPTDPDSNNPWLKEKGENK